MFLPERTLWRVFAHRAPVDMRKRRHHGLATLAQNVIAQDPCRGALLWDDPPHLGEADNRQRGHHPHKVR